MALSKEGSVIQCKTCRYRHTVQHRGVSPVIKRQALETSIQQVMSDYWKPYKEFIPHELHVQSKAETFTVEGYNSIFRYFLARLKRKSKCYSKSKQMLQHSIMLLMLKWNGKLKPILC